MIRRVEPQLAPAWRRVPEDDAMESDSRSFGPGEGTLEELMRERIRATIEIIVDEELEAALGAGRSQRVGSVRAGYRHGKRERALTTSLGATTIALPRARIEDAQGQRREWRSRMIPRYQRRTERVDEAILGVATKNSECAEKSRVLVWAAIVSPACLSSSDRLSACMPIP